MKTVKYSPKLHLPNFPNTFYFFIYHLGIELFRNILHLSHKIPGFSNNNQDLAVHILSLPTT